MGLLNNKYNQLQPTSEYLTDKAVLALAWKKAHQYIRSTNWYADTFELDRSAINLERQLNQWIEELGSEHFSFAPLQLVPAPKSEVWHFTSIDQPNEVFSLNAILSASAFESYTHKWQPVEASKGKEKPLRPLAHVSIRDQSLMTALMMCIANAVETRQKDTSLELDKVHEQGLVNYGNRLFCLYRDGEANFGWGNNTSYSKYFADYQRFLKRPMYFGVEALQQKIDGEEVFEVHLDIEKFYDRINRSVLVREVLKFCEVPDDEVLNRILTQFVNWEWDDESPALYEKVCADPDNLNIPRGIPQGLLAGGFLANIYLMNFDEELVKLIDTKIATNTETDFEITLHDYCRYVDDIRLVITTNKSIRIREIKESIEKKLSDFLPEGLKFNPEKSKIEKFRTRRSGISSKLGEIQSKVSGPLSINEIDEQLGHLEGLIALADTLRGNENIDIDNPLAGIESPNNDVREDTLLRFSANKIHSLLTKKRSLIAHEVDESGDRIASSWDYLQERMSRKFIGCWAKDPSLVLMLKKGIELFPDKRILVPVMEQLIAVTKRVNSPKQQKVAEYCLGEIFRHAATTIHIKEIGEFPAHADVNGFFECLQNYAVTIIESVPNDE